MTHNDKESGPLGIQNRQRKGISSLLESITLKMMKPIPRGSSASVGSNNRHSRRKSPSAVAPSTKKVSKMTRRTKLLCLGLLYSFLSGLFFSMCAATVKYLKDMDPGQVACYQYIAITVFSLPMVVRSGKNPLGPNKTSRYWLVLSGIFDAVTVYLSFLSFRYLPLSDATVLTSSVPVFVTITARVFLKEKCTSAQVVAIVISVLGVALVSKVPLLLASRDDVYTRESVIGVLAAIGSIISESGVYVLLRKLHEVDAFVILLNFGWVATLVNAAITLVIGEFTMAVCGVQQSLVIAVGLFSFISQLMLTKALEIEEAGPVSVLMAAGDIVLAFILDLTLFHESPDVYTVTGTVLVSSSVMIVGLKKWLDELPKGFSFKNKLRKLLSVK